MDIIANSNSQLTGKVDAAIGLLTNVPVQILNNLVANYNINNANEKIEVTILYRDTPENTRKVIESLDGTFIDLGFNFAIVRIGIDKLQSLATNDAIQYIELPKDLYESDTESDRASCITEATNKYDVAGEGILVGFIDSGIDYMHPAFRNTDGTTRIEYIYDLSTGGNVYNKETINRAIESNNPFSIVPSIDNTGHGTHVVGIACGGGNIEPKYYGVAPKASIAMVKASRGVTALSSQIMQGLKFLVDRSIELDMPLVVNISLSTNDGAHNGSSLLEQYIRIIANLERISICIAAGNEGDAGHHVGKEFSNIQNEAFNIASDETSITLNMYKRILPDISIKLTNPTGASNTIRIQEGYFQGGIGRDRYDIFVSGPKPFELNSEIKIILSSNEQYITEGVWSLQIQILNNYEGKYSIWLPVSEGLNPRTKFLEPNDFNTLGIPATVDNIIAVGSYNYRTNTLSSFSGRGVEDQSCDLRPDIVAPGENIFGPIPNGGFDSKTGTSMASPQVAGACALLMEWGINKGNDPYLFGQRLKNYLVRGAKRKRTDIVYPNPSWGYGTMCLLESLDILFDVINSIITRKEENNSDLVEDNVDIYNDDFRQENGAESNLNELQQGNYETLINSIRRNNLSETEEIGVLVQYSQPEDLDQINTNVNGARAIAISGDFAVVILPVNEIPALSKYAQIVSTTLTPAIYSLTALSPVEASNAGLFNDNPYVDLNGRGIIVALIDTGIDYLNTEFTLEDDTTRILRIWDQTISGGTPPKGIDLGSEYTEDQINEAIKLSQSGGDPYSIVPSRDEVGHGTASAGLIGGRGKNPDLVGAAPDCNFVVVKIKETAKAMLAFAGIPINTKQAYDSIYMILAIKYLSELVDELKMPMVIYFPFGTNMGAHDGTSDIEGVLELQTKRSGIVPVVGTGNQGDTQTHIQGTIAKTGDVNTIEVKVGKNQKDLNFKIYCIKPDKISLGVVSPSGEVIDRVDAKLERLKDYKFVFEGTTLSIYYSLPNEINGDEEITIRIRDIREGSWQFKLYGDYVVDGRYWSWLPQREFLDKDTRFINPIQYTTLTIPSTAIGVLTTSYYNQENNSIVSASGRGNTRDGRIKPDLTSGGINATVTTPGGGTNIASGSSVATAVLAGCCALLLQWAIVNGNDEGITNQKLISFFIRGTKTRPGEVYPNKEWGYGILDMEEVFNSIKEIASSPRGKIEELKFEDFKKVCSKYDKEIELNINKLFLRIPNI